MSSSSISLSISLPPSDRVTIVVFIFPFRVVDNSPSSLHLSLITKRICILPASINHSTSSSLHPYRHRLSLPLTSSWFIPIFLFSSSLIVSTLCRHVRSFFLDMEFHWVIFFLIHPFLSLPLIRENDPFPHSLSLKRFLNEVHAPVSSYLQG